MDERFESRSELGDGSQTSLSDGEITFLKDRVEEIESGKNF